MTLCVIFSDHPDRPDWSVSFSKGGLPEDMLDPGEWRKSGRLIAWFFDPTREKLKPNTARGDYSFELFDGTWWYGEKLVVL